MDNRDSTYLPQPSEDIQKDTFINASINNDNSSYFKNDMEKSEVKVTNISHIIESHNLDETHFHTPPHNEDKQDEYVIASSTPVASVIISGTEAEKTLEGPTADMVRSTSENLRQLAMQMNGLIGKNKVSSFGICNFFIFQKCSSTM